MSSKITLPHPIAVQMYYYFSSFTLFLTWFLAPLLFYVILTQSKSLSSYKWFLLNHAIWSLALESGIGIFKPVVLLPSPSGYIHFGESEEITFMVLFIYAPIGLASVVSVIMTTLNRYFSIFHSILTKFINTKILVFFGILIFLTLEIPALVLLLYFRPTIVKDSSKTAIEFDPVFKNLHESSLIFIPIEFYNSYAIGAGVIFCVANAGAMFGAIYFTHLLCSHLTVLSVAKLQRTLFISALFQVAIAYAFLFLPLAVLGSCIFFEIPYSYFCDCLMFSIISCHTIVDYITILSIITPYKRFLIMQINKFIGSCWKKKKSSTVGVHGPSLFASATSGYHTKEIEERKN